MPNDTCTPHTPHPAADTDTVADIVADVVPQAWESIVAHTHFVPLSRVEAERARGKRIHPAPKHLFYALHCVQPDDVRVIILGQDPYHGTYKGLSQAHGLAFSVRPPCPAPPSLKNIFMEIQRDVYKNAPAPHQSASAYAQTLDALGTDLTRWARQGVLLLNTIWTVEERSDTHSAGSHKNAGWQHVTQAVLHALAKRQPVAVLLWGKHAQTFAPIFDTPQHLVLMAAHPSPLSASRGFYGCGHFSRVNAWLKERGEKAIVW